MITYNYLGTNLRPGFYDPFYYEAKAGASITVLKDLALSGTIFYSPNYFAETGPALTLEGTASKPIAKIGGVDVAASGTVGYTTYSDATSACELLIMTTPMETSASPAPSERCRWTFAGGIRTFRRTCAMLPALPVRLGFRWHAQAFVLSWRAVVN